MSKPKRLGKFYVAFPLAENGDFSKVLAYMEFIPIRVEALYHLGKFEYIGLSPMFDEVPEGHLPRTYDIQISDNGLTIS